MYRPGAQGCPDAGTADTADGETLMGAVLLSGHFRVLLSGIAHTLASLAGCCSADLRAELLQLLSRTLFAPS